MGRKLSVLAFLCCSIVLVFMSCNNNTDSKQGIYHVTELDQEKGQITSISLSYVPAINELFSSGKINNFAGHYLDQSQRLVVMIKNLDEEVINTINSKIGDNTIIYKEATYSYKELEKIQLTILKEFIYEESAATTAYIYPMDNKVHLVATEWNQELSQKLEDLVDIHAVKIEIKSGPIVELTQE